MGSLTDYSKFHENYSKRKRTTGSFLFIIFFLIGIFAGFLFITVGEKDNSPEIKGSSTENLISNTPQFLTVEKKSSQLEEIVLNELKTANGDYAVAVLNLKNGENFSYNEHKIFEAASLYKLFVMATVFQKIQDGKITYEDILNQKISVLNEKFRISSESAELTEGDITLPVNSALSRMITISDNYSALLLTEKVRLSQVALFLEQNSLTESHVGTKGGRPATSAFDISNFFQKLYMEELASKSYTQGMLTLLKNQRLNGKIPKYLPENIEVSHKTGELGRLSHDAGIVYTPKGDFIIVVLSETPSPPVANEKIGVLSKSVYDYFTNK